MAVDLTKIQRFIDLVEKHLADGVGDADSLSVRVAAVENKVSAFDAAVLDVTALKDELTTLKSENADIKSQVAGLSDFANAINSAIDEPVAAPAPVTPLVDTPAPVETPVAETPTPVVEPEAPAE